MFQISRRKYLDRFNIEPLLSTVSSFGLLQHSFFVLIVIVFFVVQSSYTKANYRIFTDNTTSEETYIMPRCGWDVTAHRERTKNNSKQTSLQFKDRPRLQASVLSLSKRFKVHYDTTGLHSVPTKDENANNIPDYVDSTCYYLDYAYLQEVVTMGYTSPPLDFDDDSSSCDVYLVQLGTDNNYIFEGLRIPPTYGLTYPEDNLPSPCGNTRATSFILLDNDYSSSDSSTVGIKKRKTYLDTTYAALKVTCIHEFHHVIQYGYNFAIPTWIAELTSTFMEWRIFPDILNYTLYVNRVFSNSQIYYLTSNETSTASAYGYGIFFEHLYHNYGDEIIRSIWSKIGTCGEPWKTIDSSLQLRSSSLDVEWKKFMISTYFTNYRTSNKSTLSNAALLPALLSDNNNIDAQIFSTNDPSFMRNASMYPFQIKMLRCVALPRNPLLTADTIDILLSNTNLNAASTAEQRSLQYTFTITRTPQAQSSRIASSPYYLSFVRDSAFVIDTIIYTGGFAAETIEGCFPQPLSLSNPSHQNLYISLDKDALIGSPVTTTISTVDGFVLFVTTSMIEVFNGKIVTRVPITPIQLQTGVYIATSVWSDGSTINKFIAHP